MEISEVTTQAAIMATVDTVPLELNTIIAVVVMVYVAFNLYFLLEKFKIKD